MINTNPTVTEILIFVLYSYYYSFNYNLLTVRVFDWR